MRETTRSRPPRPQSSSGPRFKPAQHDRFRDRDDRDQNRNAPLEPAGLAVRELAVAVLVRVMTRSQVLDEALVWAFASERGQAMADRDKAFVRVIVATVLRRNGELGKAVRAHLDKPLPDDCGRLWQILLSAAAQLLILETPPHAAISLAVDQTRLDIGASRFSKLANAVLRRVSEAGRLNEPAETNIPPWMLARWRDAYGADAAHRIADASLEEASLDISVKSVSEGWIAQLGGSVLPTGSLRLAPAGRIEALPGYDAGAWWVQDAAAALPAQLFGDIKGKAVADLCAAPGGKTAQLANMGANVTAVDLRPERLKRLDQNMSRLQLTCETVAADASTWTPGRLFDAVLVDAPCTATGTIRRHPDILHLKRESDAAGLSGLQQRLFNNAASIVKQGGTLIYCVCSLDHAEGENQVIAFLDTHPEFERLPIKPGEVGIEAGWLTAQGDLRTLPFHLAADGATPGGLDGFFATRLVRTKA